MDSLKCFVSLSVLLPALALAQAHGRVAIKDDPNIRKDSHPKHETEATPRVLGMGEGTKDHQRGMNALGEVTRADHSSPSKKKFKAKKIKMEKEPDAPDRGSAGSSGGAVR